jgi:hypothetical protein
MLNIFKLKKKDLKVNTIETKDKGDFIGITRHYIPANKE